MIKRIYLFLNKHLCGFVRVWMLLLIPAAFIEHFAEWLVSATVGVYFIMVHGEHMKWWKEDT